MNIVLKKVADCVALNYSSVSAKGNKTANALLCPCPGTCGANRAGSWTK